MKNKTLRSFSLGGIALIAGLLWGCSDGATPDMPEKPAPAAPSVVAQAVVPAGSADQNVALDTSKGDSNASLTVTRGTGVEIRWSIKGVVKAEMTSNPDILGGPVTLEVDEKTKETNGSRFIPAVTEDVTITITAINKEGKEEKDPVTEVKVTIQISVTEPVVTLTVGKFDANPSQIREGGSSRLSWEVVPSDAKVTIADDAGNYLAPPAAQPEADAGSKAAGFAKGVDGNAVAEDNVPEKPLFPSSGAVDVSPAKDTTYTLTATTGDGQTATKTVTVTVLPLELKIASFTANGQEGNFLMDRPGDIRLSWEVVPESAVVTIDNGIGQVKTSDSVTVTVEKTTTYTITASLGDRIESKQVTVTVREAVRDEGISVSLSASANDIYAGEEITLSWDVKTPAGESAPKDMLITLNGERVEGASANVRPPATTDFYVEVSTGTGTTVRSNQVRINVRSWKAVQSGNKWRSVGVIDDNLALAGSASNSAGSIGFARISSGNLESIIFSGFPAYMAVNYAEGYPAENLEGYGPLPVNAIFSAGERVYAAATGVLLYSDNKGGSWQAADIFPIVNYDLGDTSQSEFQSCKGAKQAGDRTGKKTLANFQQLCDVITVDKRVIVATDHGVYYKDDIDKTVIAVSAIDRKCWSGILKKGKNKDACSPNELSGTVANALKAFGGSIYAATAKGVWVSGDSAATWTDYNGGDLSNSTEIYDIAIGDKTIYAAGPSGVYQRPVTAAPGEGVWTKMAGDLSGAGAVYALAVENMDGKTYIYAGTDKGVYLSRDHGATWSDISASMGNPAAVYSLAVNAGKLSVSIFAATGNGIFDAVRPVKAILEPAPVAPLSPAQSVTTVPAYEANKILF